MMETLAPVSINASVLVLSKKAMTLGPLSMPEIWASLNPFFLSRYFRYLALVRYVSPFPSDIGITSNTGKEYESRLSLLADSFSGHLEMK